MEAKNLYIQDYQHFLDFTKRYVLPAEPSTHTQLAKFHLRLMYYACEPISALAAPRGVTKSTIFAKYRPLNRLVDPCPGTTPIQRTDFLLVSETSALSKEHLDWIKHHLTSNQHLINRYGNLANPSQLTWNENEIELTNGNRCVALGYGSQVRGRHPTDIVVDDLESLNNMATEQSLAKLKDWFYRVLLGAMLPETRIGIIGTIISRNSLLSELIAAKSEFKGKIFRALYPATKEDDPAHVVDNQASIWPERWSVNYLLKRKAILGTHQFNAEYQNEPLGLGQAIIQEEWVKQHAQHQLPTTPPIRRYIACDPAFTEEKHGCYSAITIMDEQPNGTLMERYSWRKKCTAPELVTSIMHIYSHYGKECETHIGIEEVAAQKALRQHITERDPTLGAKLIPLLPDKDKVRRLSDVSRYFEFGLVSLMTPGLIDELLSFPIGDKDRVDSLVYCLKMYERYHPVINNSSSTDLPTTTDLSGHNLERYIQYAMQGIPGYTLTKEQRRQYFREKRLQEQLEEFVYM